VIDRLDGKARQAVECGDAPIERLPDSQLYEIAAGCVTGAWLAIILIVDPTLSWRPLELHAPGVLDHFMF